MRYAEIDYCDVGVRVDSNSGASDTNNNLGVFESRQSIDWADCGNDRSRSGSNYLKYCFICGFRNILCRDLYFCGVVSINGKRCIVFHRTSDHYDGIPAVFYANVYDGTERGGANYDLLPVYGADCFDVKEWFWDDFGA